MADPRLIEAAEWMQRLSGAPDASTRAAFAAWRRQSGNREAWESVAAAHGTVMALAGHAEFQAMRAGIAERSWAGDAPRRRPLWMLAAAACVAALAPLTLWFYADGPAAPGAREALVYQTLAGQRLKVTLPDGSHITLNTESQVRVSYTAAERHLVLERGQGLFEVAKDQKRPFTVFAAGQMVTAHGTIFDVRRGPDAVQVALVEGRVSVASGDPARKPVQMRPDDVLTASANSMSVRHVPGRAEALASWSMGNLVFMDETLANAVAEMNRYSASKIVIADSRAAGLRISGAFRIGKVQSFLDALELGFPIAAKRLPDGSISIASRR